MEENAKETLTPAVESDEDYDTDIEIEGLPHIFIYCYSKRCFITFINALFFINLFCLLKIVYLNFGKIIFLT